MTTAAALFAERHQGDQHRSLRHEDERGPPHIRPKSLAPRVHAQKTRPGQMIREALPLPFRLVRASHDGARRPSHQRKGNVCAVPPTANRGQLRQPLEQPRSSWTRTGFGPTTHFHQPLPVHRTSRRIYRQSSRLKGGGLRDRIQALCGPLCPALPSHREWSECRGLELISVALGSQPHLSVRLRDPACTDVFTALAEDVAPRVWEHELTRKKQACCIERIRISLAGQLYS